jgi:hypothetical protein
MIKSLAVFTITVATLAGEALPICSLVSAEDASAVLGVSAKQTRDPSGCGWEDAAHQRTLDIAYVKVPSMFEAARTKTATKGKTQDEKGLGVPAFSTVPSNDKGGRAAIYALKGGTVVIIDISKFPSGGAPDRLPQMRDLARKLISKI